MNRRVNTEVTTLLIRVGLLFLTRNRMIQSISPFQKEKLFILFSKIFSSKFYVVFQNKKVSGDPFSLSGFLHGSPLDTVTSLLRYHYCQVHYCYSYSHASNRGSKGRRLYCINLRRLRFLNYLRTSFHHSLFSSHQLTELEFHVLLLQNSEFYRKTPSSNF